MLTMRSFAEPTILLLLLFSLKSCHGQNTSPCVPSSCGNIHSITFPFRLKSDTRNCGDPRYELECQNNLTILILSSQKFLVQSIDYGSFTIRIVDLALANNNNSCSFPRNSILDIISRNNIYSDYLDLNIPLTFINCVAPVNSSRYVDIKLCTNTSSSSRTHSYIVSGNDLSLSDLEESCSVELVTWVARLPNTDDYASLSRIHEALTNGIELYWYYSLCSGCRGICSLEANSLRCHRDTICYEDVPYEEKSFLCKLEYWSPYIIILGVFPIVGILGLRFICGISCLIALVVFKRRRRHLWLECDNFEDLFKCQNHFRPIRYNYSQIKKMMNNFQDKLGVGVYGTVYKGKLRSGPPVAIKMMDKSMENAQEFPSLVAALGSLHHVNLMQLIGFYSEGMKRALVYDFMPNGSLQKYISTRELGESVCVSLSYKNLYEISLGVARGIDYLHQSSFGNQTSHFGIKSHNILLDENLIPKIADFGLSKLYPKVSYAAPEFYYKSIGDVSHKADVYSFGMLLMEMISCRTDIQNIGNDQLLAGKDIEIEDATEEERKMIKKMIKVALGCIQMKPADRPSMRKVLEILEDDDAELLEMPPKPSIVSQEIGQYHQE